MKLANIILGLLLGTGFLFSCQSEIEEATEYGYLQLSSVDVNKDITTRADITSKEAIAVDILDESELIVQHADDWKELDEVLLPAATYTIKAYSADKDKNAQGFDAKPYYEGKNTVQVEANKFKSVAITCKLAQAMVSVNCTENFKNAFSDYSCSIESSSTTIPFVKDETRAAYVKAGQALTVKVDFKNGKTFSQKVVDETKAAYHYKVKLDVTEGSASFDVSVDQTIHQYTVTIQVPTKQESADMVTDNIQFDISKVWGQFAYLSGTCNLEAITSPVQFRYKKKADSEWITVEASQVDDTKNYIAKVSPLDFGTEYEYYIVCGDKSGETCTFTTESFEEIPNLNFDAWTLGKGGLIGNKDCWFPNSDKANSYWATGNDGVVTMKSSNSIPVEDGRSGYSAQLSTISIAMVGYAAGNLFIGDYKTSTSNPASSVTFGRSYSGARPVKLSGWYKYAPGATMRDGAKIPSDRTLTSDECEIYVKLWSGETLIGEGSFVDNKNVSEYTKFECPINYVDATKRPDKITIVATSSRYGGEFEGKSVVGQLAEGSTLWVDDFELSYY